MKYIVITIFVVMVIFIILVFLISAVENKRLTTTYYEIKNKKISPEFDDYKIVMLSDLHNSSFGPKNEKLIAAIQAAKPDVILIGGDMIVGKPGESTEIPEKLINELAKTYKIYYANGNHEYRVNAYVETYKDMGRMYSKNLSSNIKWINNKCIKLIKNNKVINLYGLDIDGIYYKRFKKTVMKEGYIESKIGCCPQEQFTILLAHNPDYFPEYANWGADLTLSGHIHGGLINLPFVGGLLSPMVSFFPKYDKGLFEINNKKMILSGGLGNHTFKFRVRNLPEVIVIKLHS